jgi:hypothetical protein
MLVVGMMISGDRSCNFLTRKYGLVVASTQHERIPPDRTKGYIASNDTIDTNDTIMPSTYSLYSY